MAASRVPDHGDDSRCSLLEEVPELEEALPDEVRARARRLDAVPCATLGRGYHRDLGIAEVVDGGLGAVVLSGMLCRSVEVAGRTAAELIGPGDLVNPAATRADADGSVIALTRWHVLEPPRVAILDRGFTRRAAGCPELLSALASRTLRRVQALSLRLAIQGSVSVNDRLMLLLWHLADRWGRVTSEGVVVSLPGVSHELLAQLIGARRPSVTTSLGRLRDSGQLATLAPGRWVLAGEPPGHRPLADPIRRAHDAQDAARAVQRQSAQARRRSAELADEPSD